MSTLNRMIRFSTLSPAHGLVFLVWVLSACTANATKETPCERKCGPRPIGGNKVRALPISQGSSWTCYDRTQKWNYKALYFAYEDTTDANYAGEKADTLDRLENNRSKLVPKAGISVYPVGSSLTTDTPSDEWCTDSCGYVSFNFPLTCGDYTVPITITMPGSTGEKGGEASTPEAITITVSYVPPTQTTSPLVPLTTLTPVPTPVPTRMANPTP